MLWKTRYEINNKDEETYKKNFTRKHAGDSDISK